MSVATVSSVARTWIPGRHSWLDIILDEEIEDFVTITLEELSQGFVSHELRNSLNMLEFNES